MKRDVGHGDAVDLGFGLREAGEDGQAAFFHGLRERARRDHGNDVAMAAMFVVVGVLHLAVIMKMGGSQVGVGVGRRHGVAGGGFPTGLLAVEQHVGAGSSDAFPGVPREAQIPARKSELAQFRLQMFRRNAQVNQGAQMHIAGNAGGAIVVEDALRHFSSAFQGRG